MPRARARLALSDRTLAWGALVGAFSTAFLLLRRTGRRR